MGHEVKESSDKTQEVTTQEPQTQEVATQEKINQEPKTSKIEEDTPLVVEKKKSAIHDELSQKLASSKELAQAKYDEYLNSQKELEETTVNFVRQETHIVKTTVATSLSLLQELNVDSLEDELNEIKEIEQENKEQLLDIKSLSKGRVKAFFFGTIAALITASGATVFGAKLANIGLNAAALMQKSNIDAAASKIAELINIHQTPIAGYAVVAAVSLLVGVVVYKLVTFLQKHKNVKYVKHLESDVQNYISNLNSKIDAANQLKEHIDNIKLVIQKYDIILQEQNAKIRRMLFIEQPENGVDSLQHASQVEVEKSVLILDELLKLMNAPISEGSTITQESKQRLQSANSVINEVIRKLYI